MPVCVSHSIRVHHGETFLRVAFEDSAPKPNGQHASDRLVRPRAELHSSSLTELASTRRRTIAMPSGSPEGPQMVFVDRKCPWRSTGSACYHHGHYGSGAPRPSRTLAVAHMSKGACFTETPLIQAVDARSLLMIGSVVAAPRSSTSPPPFGSRINDYSTASAPCAPLKYWYVERARSRREEAELRKHGARHI